MKPFTKSSQRATSFYCSPAGEFGVRLPNSHLLRVQNAKIVEHVVVITPILADLPQSNGLF